MDNAVNVQLRSVSEQITNNTTSWVGHAKGDPKEISKGQTFVSDTEGDLDSIEVFSNIVTDPGKVILTVHTYDPQQKQWGDALGGASLQFNKSDSGKWMSFHIPGLHLNKGQSYGFRLESHDSLIGMGEAAGSFKNPPFGEGQEWQFSNSDGKADSFSYFSLAFRVEIRA